MDTEYLKEYLKNIYELESTLFNQNALIKTLQGKINVVKEKYIESKIEEIKTEKKMDLFTWFILFIENCVIFCIVFGFVNLYFGLPSIIVLVIAASVSIVRLYWIYKEDTAKRSKLVQDINQKNSLIISENRRIAYARENKISIITEELYKIQNLLNETKNILEMYYSQNIIYPKYRNIIAVSSFYEYMESKRCSQLEGTYGAYNLFERECWSKAIVDRLDRVIQQLEEIKNNQSRLYLAISESNRKLERISSLLDNSVEKMQRISDNAEVCAFNSEIIAQNTKYLAWIKWFENRNNGHYNEQIYNVPK